MARSRWSGALRSPGSSGATPLAHLRDQVLNPGGRLVIGVYNEEGDLDTTADRVRQCGLTVTGRTTRPHPHPRLAYKALWVDT